jgi:hypothetical protein
MGSSNRKQTVSKTVGTEVRAEVSDSVVWLLGGTVGMVVGAVVVVRGDVGLALGNVEVNVALGTSVGAAGVGAVVVGATVVGAAVVRLAVGSTVGQVEG